MSLAQARDRIQVEDANPGVPDASDDLHGAASITGHVDTRIVGRNSIVVLVSVLILILVLTLDHWF